MLLAGEDDHGGQLTPMNAWGIQGTLLHSSSSDSHCDSMRRAIISSISQKEKLRPSGGQ